MGSKSRTHHDVFDNEWITQENLAEALSMTSDVFGVSGHCIVVSPCRGGIDEMRGEGFRGSL
jgi:hypothetical protein